MGNHPLSRNSGGAVPGGSWMVNRTGPPYEGHVAEGGRTATARGCTCDTVIFQKWPEPLEAAGSSTARQRVKCKSQGLGVELLPVPKEEGGGGGGGLCGTQKCVYQKWPDKISLS